MVKFKSRYILVETLYEGERNRPFDSSKIANVLKKIVENLFGDIGLGKLNKNLQVKYMNNITNMLIIRVGKENLKLIWTALAMMNEIDSINMRMHIIGVSGSIKKAEKRAKKFLEKWMNNYEIQRKENNYNKNDNYNDNNNENNNDNNNYNN